MAEEAESSSSKMATLKVEEGNSESSKTVKAEEEGIISSESKLFPSQMSEALNQIRREREEELKRSVIPEGEEKTIKLKTTDGAIFDVEGSIVKDMETVQSFIDEGGAADRSDVIPLHNVSSRELGHILRYSSERLRLAREGNVKGLREFQKRFVEALSLDDMKQLLFAANYLNMKAFLELIAKSIAEALKNKSVELAREFFGVDNDYTPEEEEEYRREHAWAFQNVDKD